MSWRICPKIQTLVDYVHSWFVSYPIYQMDLDELAKYDPEWIEKFKTDNNIRERTIWDNLRQN